MKKIVIFLILVLFCNEARTQSDTLDQFEMREFIYNNISQFEESNACFFGQIRGVHLVIDKNGLLIDLKVNLKSNKCRITKRKSRMIFETLSSVNYLEYIKMTLRPFEILEKEKFEIYVPYNRPN